MLFAGSYIYKKIKEKKKEKENSHDLDEYQKNQLKNTIAGYIIDKYQLKSHPEGGFYTEINESPLSHLSSSPSSRPPSNQNEEEEIPSIFTNTIYYLLYNDNNHSCFHKNDGIESWHYYDGNTSMVVYEVTFNSKIKIHRLGRNIDEGEHFSITVGKGSWVAAELCNTQDSKSFALVGRTFVPSTSSISHQPHLATYDEMIQIFPQNVDLINRLTRK